MDNFESRMLGLIGEDYDFDKGLLDLDTTDKAIRLIKEMPVNRHTVQGQQVHYEGWDETESTYIDLTVNSVTGHGFHAFVGSENLMVEDAESIRIYKEAFGADVNSKPGEQGFKLPGDIH